MKTKPTPPPTQPRLPIGTKVKILRPCIWSGEEGPIERYVGDLAIVRINNTWSAGAKHGEMQVLL